MIEYFELYQSQMKAGVLFGLIGAIISFAVRDEQPTLKVTFLTIVTSVLISPIIYITSGIWITEDMIRVLCALASGYIGRPILRGIHKLALMFADAPLKIAAEITKIWGKK